MVICPLYIQDRSTDNVPGTTKQYKYSQQELGGRLSAWSVRPPRLAGPALTDSPRSPPQAQPNLPSPLDNGTHTQTYADFSANRPTNDDDTTIATTRTQRAETRRIDPSNFHDAYGACRPASVLPAIVAAKARLDSPLRRAKSQSHPRHHQSRTTSATL